MDPKVKNLENENIAQLDATIKCEMALYLARDPSTREECPFNWWKENYAAFPNL